MKNIKLIISLLLFSTLTVLTACQKDEADPRDQYLGTWQYTQTGSLTLYYAGESIGTAPLSDNGSTEITKSGENDLLIDGQLYTVNGNKLTANPESINMTDEGVNMVGTALFTGQLSSNLIVINSTITGSWSESGGTSGNFSGTVVITLTK